MTSEQRSMSRWTANPSHKDDGWWCIVGPYDPAFIAEIKLISPQYRDLVADGRVWKIHESVMPIVRGIIDRHSPPEPVPPPTFKDVRMAFKDAGTFPRPEDEVAAIHEALCLVCSPCETLEVMMTPGGDVAILALVAQVTP